MQSAANFQRGDGCDDDVGRGQPREKLRLRLSAGLHAGSRWLKLAHHISAPIPFSAPARCLSFYFFLPYFIIVFLILRREFSATKLEQKPLLEISNKVLENKKKKERKIKVQTIKKVSGFGLEPKCQLLSYIDRAGREEDRRRRRRRRMKRRRREFCLLRSVGAATIM
jgi:hypothetical protein